MVKKYTESHEWIEVTGDEATIGITDHAQKELGDIVFVELPKVGNKLNGGEEAAVLESTKAAADVYAPVSGTVSQVNSRLADAPDMVNSSPEQDGWLYKLIMSDASQLNALLDESAYRDLVK